MHEISVYNDEVLLDLKAWLQNSAAQGHQKSYRVFVDGRLVIHLTENLELLDELNVWIKPTTKVIKAQVFAKPTAHNCENYEYHTEFYIRALEAERREKEERDLKKQQSLGGFSSVEDMNRKLEEKVNQALEKDRHEREFENLKQEVIDLNSELNEARIYKAKLEKKLEEFESKKFTLTTDSISKLGTAVLGGVVKSNPELIKTLGGLAGLISPAETNTEEADENNQMTFKAKNKSSEQTMAGTETQDDEEEEEEEESEEQEYSQELDDESRAKLDLFDAAEKNMTDGQYEQFVAILKFLVQYPNYYVGTVYDILKNEKRTPKQAA